MDLHVEQPAVLPLPHRGRARNRLGQQLPLLDDSQAARTFGNQQPSVRQERETPRRLQPARHDLDLERLLLGLDHLPVGIGHVGWLRLEIRALGFQIGNQLPDLLLGELLLERHHLGVRDPVHDVAGNRLVLRSPRPHIVEETGCAPTAHVDAVAAGASFRIQGRGRIPASAAPALSGAAGGACPRSPAGGTAEDGGWVAGGAPCGTSAWAVSAVANTRAAEATIRGEVMNVGPSCSGRQRCVVRVEMWVLR